MAIKTEEDVVLSTNTELIELVNRFPINREKVRVEAADFINSERFYLCTGYADNRVYYCNNRRRRLVGVRRLPNSLVNQLSNMSILCFCTLLKIVVILPFFRLFLILG